MGMSDRIEAFLLELLKQDEDDVKIQRNELAQLFGCVPSQINYVISTRFGPERGYAVESRRGGGGYITIRRLKRRADSIGEKEAVDLIETLYGEGRLSEQAASLMAAAVSAKELTDGSRAGVLNNMLASL